MGRWSSGEAFATIGQRRPWRRAGTDARPPAWALRITQRCLTEDLGQPAEASVEAAANVDHHHLVRAFVTERGQTTHGPDPLKCAWEMGAPVFTIHHGTSRGATWHHEALNVVWLLGIADAHNYDHLCDLAASDRLMPVAADVERLVADQAPTFARALIEEVPALIELARANAGQIIEGLVAGSVPVRLRMDPDGRAPLLTVAIDQRLRPDGVLLPGGWLARLAMSFFPDTPLEEFSWVTELGSQPLRDSEIAFCDFPD
jgi:hypothetical protein